VQRVRPGRAERPDRRFSSRPATRTISGTLSRTSAGPPLRCAAGDSGSGGRPSTWRPTRWTPARCGVRSVRPGSVHDHGDGGEVGSLALANIEMRLAAVEGALMCLASALLTANQIKDLEDTASVIAAPDMVGGNVVELHPGARGTGHGRDPGPGGGFIPPRS